MSDDNKISELENNEDEVGAVREEKIKEAITEDIKITKEDKQEEVASEDKENVTVECDSTESHCHEVETFAVEDGKLLDEIQNEEAESAPQNEEDELLDYDDDDIVIDCAKIEAISFQDLNDDKERDDSMNGDFEYESDFEDADDTDSEEDEDSDDVAEFGNDEVRQIHYNFQKITENEDDKKEAQVEDEDLDQLVEENTIFNERIAIFPIHETKSRKNPAKPKKSVRFDLRQKLKYFKRSRSEMMKIFGFAAEKYAFYDETCNPLDNVIVEDCNDDDFWDSKPASSPGQHGEDNEVTVDGGKNTKNLENND